MCQEEGFKVFLDNKNNRALPLNLACLECLNVQSLVNLPLEEVSLLVQHSLVTINCTLTIGIAGLEFRYCKVRVAGYIRNDSHFINLDSVCIYTYLDSISIKTSSIPFKYSFQVWKKPWQTPLIKAPSKGENKEQRKRREEKRTKTWLSLKSGAQSVSQVISWWPIPQLLFTFLFSYLTMKNQGPCHIWY
jgi:hypothetical protein